MDVKKMAVFGLLALTVLTCAAPAGAWFGPFGGCGFGFGHGSLFPFGLFPFGLFGYPVPVPVPVAAPLCAPGPCGIGAPGLGLGGCGVGAPGLGLGGFGWGNNPAIPGPI
jgi:hypothetical protein